MATRLTKKSLAVKNLRALFERGIITGTEEPRTVYQMDASFQKHKLDNFRTCYNRMKKDYVADAQDENDGDTLNRMCTKPDSDVKRRRVSRALIQDMADEDEDDVDAPQQGSHIQCVAEKAEFKPLYLISDWVEPGTMTKRLSVAIILPSGIGAGQFSVRVIEGGLRLELTVTWPTPLLNIDIMHRDWLSNTESGFVQYHTKYVGFEATLRRFRERSTHKITSTAHIPLPYPVQTHMDGKENLTWRDNETKMVYVDLKAFVEDYAVENDNQEFHVV